MFTVEDYPSIVNASIKAYLIITLNHLAHENKLLECKRTFYVDTLMNYCAETPSVYFYERHYTKETKR